MKFARYLPENVRRARDTFREMTGTAGKRFPYPYFAARLRGVSLAEYVGGCHASSADTLPEDPQEAVDLSCRWAGSTVQGLDALLTVANVGFHHGWEVRARSYSGWTAQMNMPRTQANRIAAVDPINLTSIPRGGTAPTISWNFQSEGWNLNRIGGLAKVDEQDLADMQEVGDFMLMFVETGRAFQGVVADLISSFILENADLADGTAMFHADRSNLTTDALASATLKSGMGSVVNQTVTDESTGTPVHVNPLPGFLVVPGDLYATGLELNDALGGPLEVRPESRLSAAGVLDPGSAGTELTVRTGSATNWLLACNSDQTPGIILGALDGRFEPSLRSFQLQGGEFGVGFDMKLDIGVTCAPGGAKSLYFSDGTGA